MRWNFTDSDEIFQNSNFRRLLIGSVSIIHVTIAREDHTRSERPPISSARPRARLTKV